MRFQIAFLGGAEGMLLKGGMGNGEWDDSGEWEIEMGILKKN